MEGTNSVIGTQSHPLYVNIHIESKELAMIVQFLLQSNIYFKVVSPSSNSTQLEKSNDSPSNSLKKSVVKHPLSKYKDIEKVDSILDNHLANGKNPDMQQVSQSLGLSISVFKRIFKETYGMSFYEYYLSKKMTYAAELLLKGLRGGLVSEMIGYSQPIKFTKMFKKHFGITPKKYQLQYKSASGISL
ncbi:helix-turn-helix transcriptional regulator [Runella aurantiaca]|uniref:AraC family transcriptional regulator n=1 Tax=Runella aurantiaca TaxID=2282308 RepID=A0A369II46_9BACT|nr:AraC family transcriptional regulator [Runella aurantiaca]RDB07855.1 AraC family transcriptional regulator [Runella aurantiaca]